MRGSLGEWKGTSNRARSLLAVGLVLLILTAVISGYSSYLGQAKPVPVLTE